MSDAWLIIGIFVAAFILWAYTGGPDRPISFAGPYITPIADFGDMQEGYDDEGGRAAPVSWRSGSGRLDSLWARDGSADAYGETSPYTGDVNISSGSGGPSQTEASQEYVAIRVASGAGSVNVTGWRIMSMESGASVTIPQAQPIAQQAGSADVVLAPGGEAFISTGSSPIGASFRENACIGYIANRYQFSPALGGSSCPAPADELGAFFEGDGAAYNECREAVRGFARCEVPTAPSGISSRCRSFIQERLNYPGCVRVHQDDAEFFGDTWRVYLGQRTELWRTDNETLRLVDREGRTVDVYAY